MKLLEQIIVKIIVIPLYIVSILWEIIRHGVFIIQDFLGAIIENVTSCKNRVVRDGKIARKMLTTTEVTLKLFNRFRKGEKEE
ncbi:hypothetical protein NNG48_07260 [Enterococcus faecium]|nr:hypothetical protein [Enterococcus faecium]